MSEEKIFERARLPDLINLSDAMIPQLEDHFIKLQEELSQALESAHQLEGIKKVSTTESELDGTIAQLENQLSTLSESEEVLQKLSTLEFKLFGAEELRRSIEGKKRATSHSLKVLENLRRNKTEVEYKLNALRKLIPLGHYREEIQLLLSDPGTKNSAVSELETAIITPEIIAQLNEDLVRKKAIEMAARAKDFSDLGGYGERMIELIVNDRKIIESRLNHSLVLCADGILSEFISSAVESEVAIYQELLENGANFIPGAEAVADPLELSTVEDLDDLVVTEVALALPSTGRVAPVVIEAEIVDPDAIIALESVTPYEPFDDMGGEEDIVEIEPIPVEQLQWLSMNLFGLELDPRLPTAPTLRERQNIADGRPLGVTLSEDAQFALACFGEEICPDLSLDFLTEAELLAVYAIVDGKLALPPEKAHKELTDIAYLIIEASQAHMKGKIHPTIVRAAERVIKAELNGEAYKPQQRTLKLLTMGALIVQAQHLLERSVDIRTMDRTGKLRESLVTAIDEANNVIVDEKKLQINKGTLFTLRAIQEVVEAPSMAERVERLVPSFGELIAFHADLILKCRAAGKKLGDFIGPKAAKRLSGCIDLLRSVTSYAGNYDRVTALQEPACLSAFDSYNEIISLWLKNNQEFSDLKDAELVRTPDYPEAAWLEACLILDDSPMRNKRSAQANENVVKNYRVINDALARLKGLAECDLSLLDQTLRGDTSILKVKDVAVPLVTYYLRMESSERAEFVILCLGSIKDGSDKERKVGVLKKLFAILDHYLVEEPIAIN